VDAHNIWLLASIALQKGAVVLAKRLSMLDKATIMSVAIFFYLHTLACHTRARMVMIDGGTGSARKYRAWKWCAV